MKKRQKSDWKTFVPSLTHAYNATMHESTGYSPSYLMIGRHPHLAIDAFLWIGLSEEHKSHQDYVDGLNMLLPFNGLLKPEDEELGNRKSKYQLQK